MSGVSRVPELIIVVVILVLIMGPGKLPQLGKGVGEMIRGFRQETGTGKSEEVDAKAEEASPKA
jgi:sec-independent protein translocase protein TatA